MKICKTIVIFLAVMSLLVGTAFATSERSMTPPADYDEWSDAAVAIRGEIGFGDIYCHSTEAALPEVVFRQGGLVLIAGWT